MLVTCPEEESLMCSKLMQWNCYELVIHGKAHIGVNNKVLWLHYKEILAHTFLEYLKPKLCKFIFRDSMVQFRQEKY
jgi:hypothetical protein